MSITDALRRNLEHVRDHGRAMPRSIAAYHCRKRGFTEFVWRLPDGLIVTSDQVRDRQMWDVAEVMGERLTEAGKQALWGKL